MSTAKLKSRLGYDVHPSLAMLEFAIEGLKQKTGRTLEEWVKLVGNEGPETEKERREWLKTKYQLGGNDASWIAERSVGKGWGGNPKTYLKRADIFVERMFRRAKVDLRPIYEELLKMGRKVGPDVKVCPCQTFVPLYRNRVFAQIKIANRKRIDLGLALKDTKTPKRLINTGGFARKDRISHRIEINSVNDIDGEVKKWLKKAYDMDE